LLQREGVDASRLKTIIHGTTLVTNALIERRGAPTALLTTEGFRDAVAIGTEHRYDMYDIFLEKPEPLVPAQPALRRPRARPRRRLGAARSRRGAGEGHRG
jgi:N-methylhydantoinase A/oxoprolinase/acetone carboxylase beta subunit